MQSSDAAPHSPRSEQLAKSPCHTPRVPSKRLQFLHTDLGFRSGGDVVVVTLSEAANVRLLDSVNFSQYQNGSRHNYHGGLATRSPVRLPIPHSGIWHVVMDLQGLANSTRASVRVINGESLRPLPPIPDQIPAPRPTLADLVDNASAGLRAQVAHATGTSSSHTRPRTKRPSQGHSHTRYESEASASGTTSSNSGSATASGAASTAA